MSSDNAQPMDEVLHAWGRVHDTMTAICASEIGEKRLKELLHMPMRKLGAEAAAGSMPDAAAIGRRIMQFECHWNIQGRILEDSAARFVREVTYCPWAYFKPMSCKVLGWYMEGFCEAMNGDCRYYLDKLIPAGDRTCQWSIIR